jgi:hypothetical protein
VRWGAAGCGAVTIVFASGLEPDDPAIKSRMIARPANSGSGLRPINSILYLFQSVCLITSVDGFASVVVPHISNDVDQQNHTEQFQRGSQKQKRQNE